MRGGLKAPLNKPYMKRRTARRATAKDEMTPLSIPPSGSRPRTPLGLILRRARPLIVMLTLMWLAHALNVGLGGALTETLGLIPRTTEGLTGVLAMPFVHGDWAHLIANSGPMIALGGMIIVLAPRRILPVTAFVVIVSGALIWLFARAHIHIGASAVVFGWFGYLVALGLLERSREAMLGAFLAIAFFGASMFAGVLPDDPRVSWDGHLAGLVAGIAAAWPFRRRPTKLRVLH